MADIAELDTAPDTIEASLNYLADTGEKLVTQVAEPGGRWPGVSSSSARVSALSITRQRSAISPTRTRSTGSTTRRWWS